MRRVELRRPARGGPVVTFLHGFLGVPEQGMELARRLPSEVGVEAIELPGHGADPWMPEGTFGDIVAEISRALPRTDDRTLVGYSFGGRLALAMLAAAEAVARRGVVIGAHTGMSEVEREARRRADEVRADRVRSEGLRAFVEAWECEPLFASQARLVPASTLDAQRRQRQSHTAAGIAWSLVHLGTGAMPPIAVEALRVPVVFVAGALDAAFAEVARSATARCPLARAAIVDGAGHNVLLEAPDALAEIVAASIPRSINTGKECS